MPKIAIVGATTWGITLGTILATKGLEVGLWARTKREATKIGKIRPTSERFPGVNFPPQLTITDSLSEALKNARAVVLVVPSQTMRENITSVKNYLTASTLVISAAKGLELGTNKRMTQVIADVIDSRFHHNICVISGPNLYKEVLRGLPAATVVAAKDEKVAKKAQRLLNTTNFCVYTNTDVTGVELGGALKNIIALGAGIADGLGYGDNTKAAFITRGLTEITALGVALGASPLTFSGLAGLGDLVATCASPLSRNHFVGVELTRGRSLEEIIGSMDGTAEGVSTTSAAWELAQELNLEMPITEKVYNVLYNGLDPKQAAAELMTAETKHELTGRKWKLFAFLKRRKGS